MMLKEWLFRNDMKASSFARELGITPSYFFLVKNRKIIPGLQLAKQIELITGGQVTAIELREEKSHG
jgi:DNA-binding transcriptional regulator YdaS (Cro superfamily)